MKDSRLKGMVLTAVMAAVICVLSPFSIPIGPVPVSLTNFAIFITLYVLGTKRGTRSVLIYLMIGQVNLKIQILIYSFLMKQIKIRTFWITARNIISKSLALEIIKT